MQIAPGSDVPWDARPVGSHMVLKTSPVRGKISRPPFYCPRTSEDRFMFLGPRGSQILIPLTRVSSPSLSQPVNVGWHINEMKDRWSFWPDRGNLCLYPPRAKVVMPFGNQRWSFVVQSV